MEEIATALRQYGLETVLLALAINICTTVCKIPVKLLARKTKNSANITRFIVFMPIILGFVITLCYVKFFTRCLVIDKSFIKLWLTSSGLSLTFYAVFEKVMLPKNKSDSNAELAASREIIEKLQAAVNGNNRTEQSGEKDDEQTSKEETYTTCAESAKPTTKIILRGNRDDKTE